MKRLSFSLVALVLGANLVVSGCSPAAAPAPTQAPAKPPAAPTTAPAKPAESTKAPAAPAPTQAAAPAKKLDWPQKGKAINIIVPYSVGGSVDIGTRAVTPTMEKVLGTTIEVVNKPGGGSQVGATEAMKSKPDGYTLGAMTAMTTAVVYLDPERQSAFARKDIQPVASRVRDAATFTVRADSPYKSLKDLVDAAKANPGKIKIATRGPGTTGNMTALLLEKVAGVKFTQVAFDQAGPMRAASLGGHVDVETGTVGDFVTAIRSGEIRAIAVFQDEPHKYLAGVKTAKSEGYDVKLEAIQGLAAPAGTPMEIVQVISGALKQALEDQAVAKKMEELGLEVHYLDTAAFSKHWDEMDVKMKELLDIIKKG